MDLSNCKTLEEVDEWTIKAFEQAGGNLYAAIVFSTALRRAFDLGFNARMGAYEVSQREQERRTRPRGDITPCPCTGPCGNVACPNLKAT